MKQYFLLSAALLLAAVSCTTNKADSTAEPAVNNEEQVNEEAICEAICNYYLHKPGAATLSSTARNETYGSSWPEVQCHVDGDLYNPKSFKDHTVRKVGEGQYKFECTCPRHGDKYVDVCTIHASMNEDGTVVIEHVKWK